MGRTLLDNIVRKLWENRKVENNEYFCLNPIELIKEVSGPSSYYYHLRKLENLGFIGRIKNKNKRANWDKIFFNNEKIPEIIRITGDKLQSQDTAGEEIKKDKIGCVILVDGENLYYLSKESNVGLDEVLSFITDEALKKFGRIHFKLTFAKIGLDQRILRIFYNKGFFVITMPLGFKEKDSTDEGIKFFALKLLYSSNVKDFVIVSSDNDFINLINVIKDFGANVFVIKPHIQVGVFKIKENNGEFQKLISDFKKLIERIFEGKAIFTELYRNVRLLKVSLHIVNEVSEKKRRLGFRKLLEFLKFEIITREFSAIEKFSIYEIRACLQALIDSGCIEKKQSERGFKYYVISEKGIELMKRVSRIRT